MWKYGVIAIVFFAFAKANSQQTSATANNIVFLNQHPAAKTVELFFKDFHVQDTSSLRSYFVKEASLVSLSSRNGEENTTKTSLAGFLQNIASIPSSIKFKEELTSVKSLESEGIVSVHAGYVFYLNKKKSHSGTNVFTMILLDQEWKISQITDTRFY